MATLADSRVTKSIGNENDRADVEHEVRTSK